MARTSPPTGISHERNERLRETVNKLFRLMSEPQSHHSALWVRDTQLTEYTANGAQRKDTYELPLPLMCADLYFVILQVGKFDF